MSMPMPAASAGNPEWIRWYLANGMFLDAHRLERQANPLSGYLCPEDCLDEDEEQDEE